MGIHIHQRRIHFQVQQPRRMPAVEHHVVVRPAHRMGHRAVEDGPAVQKQVLHIALAAGILRPRQPAAKMDALALFLKIQCMLDKLRTQKLRDPFLLPLAVLSARQVVTQAAILFVTQAGGVATEGHSQQRPIYVPRFGCRFTQKTAPRRRVVEQIADLNRGAGRVRRGAGLGGAAAGTAHRPAAALAGRARSERKPRHGRNAGKRLAAKPQGGDRSQVVQAGNLAGGVPGQRHRQFVRPYPHAVVANAAQPGATLLHLHEDPSCARVEAVLQQFLDHRRRALHHLARGNLVDQVVRQQLNSHRMAANTLRVFKGFPSR